MSAQEPLHCISRALRLLGTIQHQLSKLVWSWYFNQVHYFSGEAEGAVENSVNVRWLAPQLGVNRFLDVKKVFWPEEAYVTSKMLRHLTCPVEVRAGLGATEAHKENLVTLLKMFYKPFRPSSKIKGNGNGYNRV
ncbi:hypothetical protein DFH08DRAFT_817942 [Mycena albidolilacea]|uniref:Uncharacterized protein n=1 Tax=Mycena albidolilacea TaxID=1033008 RepID=A0AAD7EGU0_9AGAR|nr:hypothetical protein DFH08DRAFT_817942 [Mycena albidolilacea]